MCALRSVAQRCGRMVSVSRRARSESRLPWFRSRVRAYAPPRPPPIRPAHESGRGLPSRCRSKGSTIERMFAWLDDLTAAQREVVTHDGGPLRVLAGAGTGKTTTLSARVAWLLATGTPPERILLLTFTRRAARQMLSRTANLLSTANNAGGDGRAANRV